MSAKVKTKVKFLGPILEDQKNNSQDNSIFFISLFVDDSEKLLFPALF